MRTQSNRETRRLLETAVGANPLAMQSRTIAVAAVAASSDVSKNNL